MTKQTWELPADIDWQECYLTKDLIKLLKNLQKHGYTGLSLGLIVDLVRDSERLA